jgi:hypothetical protein
MIKIGNNKINTVAQIKSKRNANREHIKDKESKINKMEKVKYDTL